MALTQSFLSKILLELTNIFTLLINSTYGNIVYISKRLKMICLLLLRGESD
jgi:hypothetical protein